MTSAGADRLVDTGPAGGQGGNRWPWRARAHDRVAAGADSIGDVALLRHGAVASRLPVEPAGRPPLLTRAAEPAHPNVDHTVRPTCAYAEHGAVLA